MSAAPEPDAGAIEAPLRRRLPAAARDVLLVVLGAGLALAADEWRDGRDRARRTRLALSGIRAELHENVRLVDSARARHLAMRDTLSAYAARGETPPERVYFFGGMFNPAAVRETAWQAAREAGVLADVPYATVLRLAPLYEAQARYRTLGDGIVETLMADVARQGVETVFRDRYRHFVTLDTDFANRERVLLEHYRTTLPAVDSALRAR